MTEDTGMTIDQTAAVVAKVQLGDNRKVDAQVVREWHEQIGHNSLADAMTAVIEHRKWETVYLVPAHVNAACKRMREARAEARHHAALVAPDRARFPSIPDDIMQALESSWRDPVRYAAAEARLNEYLDGAGFTRVGQTFLGLSPVGSGVDESRTSQRGHR